MEKIIATMMYNNNKFYLSLILSLTMLLQSFLHSLRLTVYCNVIKGSATDSTRRGRITLIGSCRKDAPVCPNKPKATFELQAKPFELQFFVPNSQTN